MDHPAGIGDLLWLIQLVIGVLLSITGVLMMQVLSRIYRALDKMLDRLDDHERRLSRIEGHERWRPEAK